MAGFFMPIFPPYFFNQSRVLKFSKLFFITKLKGQIKMDMYPKYISPFGYQTGQNRIDSYGVNHSGFSLRDELEYQFARQKRENLLRE